MSASTAAAAASWLGPAVESLKACEAIYITAGAGMSADSGLPTFRSKEGFWRAYPPAAKAGLSFSQVSNPASFDRDERLAWGFFGHRYHLYTRAEPHQGYNILLKWARSAEKHFVFTSNVDGMFSRAGFEESSVCECHGSIHFVQARDPSLHGSMIAPASDSLLPSLVVDDHFRAQGDLPVIRSTLTGKLEVARPNILMFGDWKWVPKRTEAQESAKRDFLGSLKRDTKLVIVEIGAGKAVPTVRHESEDALDLTSNATLIRINPDEPQGPPGTISVPLGGLAALKAIDEALATA